MWQADQRHGPGVVVTQAGVCYQGTFQGDKMAVSGSPCPGRSVGELKPSWVGDKGCPALPPSTLALAQSGLLLASLPPFATQVNDADGTHMSSQEPSVPQDSQWPHGPRTSPG